VTEVARHNAWDSTATDDLRDELVEWAMDVSPSTPTVHRKRSTAIAD
jgi:hypothetical protein